MFHHTGYLTVTDANFTSNLAAVDGLAVASLGYIDIDDRSSLFANNSFYCPLGQFSSTKDDSVSERHDKSLIGCVSTLASVQVAQTLVDVRNSAEILVLQSQEHEHWALFRNTCIHSRSIQDSAPFGKPASHAGVSQTCKCADRDIGLVVGHRHSSCHRSVARRLWDMRNQPRNHR